MRISLVPLGTIDTLQVIKQDKVLTFNGESFDFSLMKNGDTLPWTALSSKWITGGVECDADGELSLNVILPIPWNYSQEQAFPVPLLNVPNGVVVFPKPLPTEGIDVPQQIEWSPAVGLIDWSQLITSQMKIDAAAKLQLATVKAELVSRNTKAAYQIARIQDRIDTLGYGIDAGQATEEDEAEQVALMLNIKLWKTYKFALGKVSTKPSWPANPEWPVEPPVPYITDGQSSRSVNLM